MKIVGIVIAKKESKRFNNKNIYIVNGVPMFWHAVCPLLKSNVIDDVYVATDSDIIKEYCRKREVNIIHRGVNAIHNDEPLFSILKHIYKCIENRYDIVVSILANSIGHQAIDIDKCVSMLIKNTELKEVRSCGRGNIENGILAIRESVIYNKHELSTYIGMIKSYGVEIHYEKDLKSLI